MEFLLTQAVYLMPIAVAVVVLASYAALSRGSKGGSSPHTSPASTPIKEHLSLKLKEKVASSVLDQFSLKQKLSLQTRVANAMTADDLLNIFSDYRELEHLRLTTEKITSDESLNQANEQAFKDLIRERVLINEVAVEPMEHDSKDFRKKFQARIQDTISKHVSDSKLQDLIAKHLCCHLSRTRAGGDSFFAIQDIFATPQFTITAAAAYTHPPTSLLVTNDGWAVVTTTSNFDVYCQTDLSGEDDGHPEALVTISALVEEAVPLSKNAKAAWVQFMHLNGRVEEPEKVVDERHAVALPVSRTLRLTCTLPVPSMYYGYAEKSFGLSPRSSSGQSSPSDFTATRSGSGDEAKHSCGSCGSRGFSSLDPVGNSNRMGSANLRQPSSSLPSSKEGAIMQKSIESLRETGAFKKRGE
jgi:hypothetical protein